MPSVSEFTRLTNEQVGKIKDQFVAELVLPDMILPRHQFIISIVKSPGVGGTAAGWMLAELATAQLVQANSARFLLGKQDLDWSGNVHRLCEAVAHDVAARKWPIILDGGGRTKGARRRIKALANDLGLHVYFICILCEPEIAEQRARRRYADGAESTFDDWRTSPEKFDSKDGKSYISSIKKLGTELKNSLWKEKEGPVEGLWTIDNSGTPAALTKQVGAYWKMLHQIEMNR